MKLKSAIEISSSLKFIIENLKLQSNIGKRILLNQVFCTDKDELINEFDSISLLKNKIEENTKLVEDFNIKLYRIKDIRGSLDNLKGQNTLDDIELFEIKSFCILAEEIRLLCDEYKIHIIEIPHLQQVIDVLDPEGNKVPTFYVYDIYSEELHKLRKKIKSLGKENAEKIEELRFQAEKIEDSIRQSISADLFANVDKIQIALERIAKLDILLSKSIQVIEMNLCKPEISRSTTSYKSLINPQISENLKSKGKKYQAIDIDIHKSPCLITGANMSGKTVLLKTVAMAQYLLQFGFYIPAQEAKICLVDKIMLCIDDKQNELKGLSSFAAEILEVNYIIQEIKKNSDVLVLIDELAKTTNPVEGSAIVNAVLEILDKYHVRSLITTHYSDINYRTRRLRVKGLKDDSANINKDNINDFIDYSLVETEETEVPHEAIRIAEILGVDEEFLQKLKITS
ncbi:MAG: DNA mismatch repair protein MutS [Bacteroidales bacterium]|jgi:DNA mismatch repair ATPase MutS|nr:DNA mismatch repair protein MutS [Bacteroidales bacterium]